MNEAQAEKIIMDASARSKEILAEINVSYDDDEQRLKALTVTAAQLVALARLTFQNDEDREHWEVNVFRPAAEIFYSSIEASP